MRGEESDVARIRPRIITEGGAVKRGQKLGVLGCLLLICPFRGNGAAFSYSVGEKWLVTAVYRSPSGRGDSWSPPIVWEYSIEKMDRNSEGRPIAEIQIRDPEGLRSETATLTIDLTRMSLLTVKCEYLVQGRRKRLIQDYPAGGSSVLRFPITTAPFLVPGIPTDSLHFHREGQREFRTRKATVEDFQIARDAVLSSMKSQPLRVGRGFDHFDDLFVVEISEGLHRKLYQIWKRNRPWPVYTEAFGCRSFTDEAFTNKER